MKSVLGVDIRMGNDEQDTQRNCFDRFLETSVGIVSRPPRGWMYRMVSFFMAVMLSLLVYTVNDSLYLMHWMGGMNFSLCVTLMVSYTLWFLCMIYFCVATAFVYENKRVQALMGVVYTMSGFIFGVISTTTLFAHKVTLR